MKPLEYLLPYDVTKMWNGSVIMNKLNKTTGEWEEVEWKNIVLLGGLKVLSKLLYHVEPVTKINTFEHDLYQDAVTDETDFITHNEEDLPFVQGFNLASDGAQGDAIIPYPRHKCGYDFDHLIPFRMIPIEENDYADYRNIYLHSRVVELDGKQYVQYFTKKMSIQSRAKLDDDTEIPNYPNENLTTSKDSRVVADFPINITDDELAEWFRLTKRGGAQSTVYSAVLLMIGQPAKWKPNGQGEAEYDSMINSYVMSRCNHAPVPHGVDGTIVCKYRIMHI